MDMKVTLTVKRLGKDTNEDITLNRARIANPTITEYAKRLKAYKAKIPGGHSLEATLFCWAWLW